MNTKILIALLLTITNSVYGQELEALQTLLFDDFSEVFKEEGFEILDTVETKIISEDEIYFLMKVIPKNEGTYFIKQLFEHKPDWGYKNNSILNIIKASKKGTPRFFNGLEPSLAYSSSCWIGDTIGVPVFWNKHINTSKFAKAEKREREIYGKREALSTHKKETGQLDWRFTNTVAEVSVKDISTGYAVYRHLREELVSHTIRLKAVKQGEFTLRIGEIEQKLSIHPKENNISKTVTQVVGKQWEGATSYSLPPGYDKSHFVKQPELRVGDMTTITFLSYTQEVKKPKKVYTYIEIHKLAL
ncbi:hypothetical protein N9954_03825 [Maribacter sp.]|nr:hypothetical protein [Maribacter sp.]